MTQPEKLDLIAVGDATLDTFLGLHEANVMCQLYRDKCELCLNYADKIPVASLDTVAGAGNASNCAVGASRLLLKSGIVSILGNDDVGRTILRRWTGEGIDIEHVVIDQDHPTNHSTVLNFHTERTILVYQEERQYVFPSDLTPASWLYVTSLGNGSENMHPAIVDYVKQTGAKLVFQPDAYQLRLGRAALQPLLDVASILIMNREEARRLLGEDKEDIKEELNNLKATGCRLALITDGAKGSYAYDGESYHHMGIFDVPVVERTGGGDAFSVGFIAALHHGKPLPEALRWGTANSSSVIGQIGPQAGLLNPSGIEELLRRFPDVQPSEI